MKKWQISGFRTEEDYWSSAEERLRWEEEVSSLKGHKCIPVTSDPREQEGDANGEHKHE